MQPKQPASQSSASLEELEKDKKILSDLIEKYGKIFLEDEALKTLNVVFLVFDNHMYRAMGKGDELYAARVAELYAKGIYQKLVDNKDIAVMDASDETKH